VADARRGWHDIPVGHSPSAGRHGHYVSFSAPDSVKDTKLLEAVAKRLDVELATGTYDSLFGK